MGLCLGLTLLLKHHCPWWHSLYQYTAWCDMLQMVRFLFCLALLSFCIGKYQLKAELHGRNVSLTWRDFKPPDYQFEYSVAISTSLTTTTWKKVEVRLFKQKKKEWYNVLYFSRCILYHLLYSVFTRYVYTIFASKDYGPILLFKLCVCLVNTPKKKEF